MWLSLEEVVTAGPAAGQSQLPMRRKPWHSFQEGRGAILFHNSNSADDLMSSRGAGMCTWNPFCPPLHRLPKRVGVMYPDIPAGDNSRKQTRGLRIPSWVSPFSASQFLARTYLEPGSKVLRLAWLTSFPKDSLLFRASRPFYISHVVKQVGEMQWFFFFPLY